MAKAIPIHKLANEIVNAVREYTEDVQEAIAKEVDDTAKKVLRDVKALSPKRTGEYASTFVRTNKSLAAHGRRMYVIWNKKHYRRVHLLEFGHALRNGGRAPEFPHLRPAHDKHVPQMVENIKRIIQNGG
ncbi:HK97 gp10 family phage protein [Desulfoscipio geothermicus]|uniref:Bacteriophage HK97-gp10, putative tail-component n=1 Tax=Desulfoscipio geothermicus DSM 3669 TaxID=1121426 RepID=A0A1I6EBY4_9FIRM|nr:HK97 gp10 family phage protein [Desulfoscipio geothermicus]SFR15256.1 Bacteriophage HK97-gp10, putative tail-component [Desulfoscipio geothermicus DSM 3669]